MKLSLIIKQLKNAFEVYVNFERKYGINRMKYLKKS